LADVPLEKEKEELITNKMVVQNTCGASKCLRELIYKVLSQEPLAISRQEWMTKWMIIRSSQCKALQ
jgi:hypothetical protein